MFSPLTGGDGHPKDQSDQSVHLLLQPQPGKLSEVGHPPGGEDEAQVVSIVTCQTPHNTGQISLHEDPGCQGVRTEPAREGKFETECFQICQ